jgi:peptide deformylase
MTDGKILPITIYGSSILREVCLEAENKPEIITLANDLVTTMNAIGTAVGLAAPQVNSRKRVFVMKHSNRVLTVINPTIGKRRYKTKSDESCLSIPKLYGTVPERDEIIDVEFYDENFTHQKMRLRGFSAIVFQHEIHHLDGILYTDLLSSEGKELVADKLSDIAKGIYKVEYPTMLM